MHLYRLAIWLLWASGICCCRPASAVNTQSASALIQTSASVNSRSSRVRDKRLGSDPEGGACLRGQGT